MVAIGRIGSPKLILNLRRVQTHFRFRVEISTVADETVFGIERCTTSHFLGQAHPSLHRRAAHAGQRMQTGLDSTANHARNSSIRARPALCSMFALSSKSLVSANTREQHSGLLA